MPRYGVFIIEIAKKSEYEIILYENLGGSRTLHGSGTVLLLHWKGVRQKCFYNP